MAYLYAGYDGNCSLSLQNCGTLYPKNSVAAYGPPYRTGSCITYPFYASSGDVGICGWKGAPCSVDSTGRTSCNNAFGYCVGGVCAGSLGESCTLGSSPFCLGVIGCGVDGRCGGAGADAHGYLNNNIPVAQLCLSGAIDSSTKCTTPSGSSSGSSNPVPVPASSTIRTSTPVGGIPTTSVTNTAKGPSDTPIAPANSGSLLQSLENCAPCGSDHCTFTSQGVASTDTYVLVVGKPVANCQQGNSQTVTTKYVGEMDIAETWSVDNTVGIGVGGLKVDTTVGWSHATTVKASQEVSLNVVSGQMGALVANVSYKKTSGKMSIGSSSYGMVSAQPQSILNYAVQYASCGSQFQAFTLGSTDCAATSGALVASDVCHVHLVLVVVFLLVGWV